jgi:hypothetical protein
MIEAVLIIRFFLLSRQNGSATLIQFDALGHQRRNHNQFQRTTRRHFYFANKENDSKRWKGFGGERELDPKDTSDVMFIFGYSARREPMTGQFSFEFPFC